MKSSLLITMALGLVAAFAFVSATTGPLFLRAILVFVTPLPLAVAALGWGWFSGLTAGLAGCVFMLLIGGPMVAVAYFVSQVVPIVALCYFATLSRPIGGEAGAVVPANGGGHAQSQAPQLEYYPIGRIILWAAALAGGIATVALLIVGNDLDELRKVLTDFVDQTVKRNTPSAGAAQSLSEADKASIVEVILNFMPAGMAISFMGSLLFNLWLAGRIALASEQLTRPWPDLAVFDYPLGTGLAFTAALIGTTFGGMPGLIAAAFAGAFFLAYMLLGLAVIHYVTRPKPWRGFALFAVYALLFLTNIWVAIVIAILGLVEQVFMIRARAGVFPAQNPPSGDG